MGCSYPTSNKLYSLTVQRPEETVQEIAVMGPGMSTLHNGVGYFFALSVGDPHGLVVAQLRRSVGSKDNLAPFRFDENLQAIVALHLAVRRLVNVKLGATHQLVKVIVTVPTPTSLTEGPSIKPMVPQITINHLSVSLRQSIPNQRFVTIRYGSVAR